MRPRLLDLFCGAGGATRGYQEAGFYVVGVDIAPQPNYCGDEFVQRDVMDFGRCDWWRTFDAIHASPPCHDHSSLGHARDGTGWLLNTTLDLLQQTELPWVCENVVGPDVKMAGWWFTLCGSMFGLQVQRHRRFGASFLVMQPDCNHVWERGRPYTVTGDGGRDVSPHSLKPRAQDFWRYLDMPWMEGKPPEGVAQAIPPAYTRFIGEQLRAALPDNTEET